MRPHPKPGDQQRSKSITISLPYATTDHGSTTSALTKCTTEAARRHTAQLATHPTPTPAHPARRTPSTPPSTSPSASQSGLLTPITRPLNLHLSVSYALHDINHAERTAPDRAEERQARNRPKNELEIKVIPHMRTAVHLAHRHGQHGIRHHPARHHVRPHGAVIVLLHLGLARRRLHDLDAIAQVAQRLVVARIDVELLARHLELDDVAALGRLGGAEVGVADVVALGAPGDVVGVAEGVHLQGADVGGEQGKVLRGRGEHVPRVEVEEGHEEVQADGGAGGDDEVGEDIVAELELGAGCGDLAYDDVDRGEGGVRHDDAVPNHGGEEHFLGALRPIAHGEDELHANEEDT